MTEPTELPGSPRMIRRVTYRDAEGRRCTAFGETLVPGDVTIESDTMIPLPPPHPREQVPESSDRDERRLIAGLVRLVMRLPRVARYGLLVAALGGAGELGGIFDPAPAPTRPGPSRAQDPALRLERVDRDQLEGRHAR